MPTEAQVRQWAREEYDKKRAEEQALCPHLVSGSMRDGEAYCDSCGKLLDWRDGSTEPSGPEQRGIDRMRSAR